MASFEFSKEEFSDMIYAAREARIRFKRARTEFRALNKSYMMWDEETLEERICHFDNLEKSLCEKYQAAFGEEW